MNTPSFQRYKPYILGFWIFLFMILSLACSFTVTGNTKDELWKTIAVQETKVAGMATQIGQLEEINTSQWKVINYLATQMPYALELITPIPAGVTITPTPFPRCTPPPCEEGEVFHCPGQCPGGCGTTCATPTPGG